MNWPYYIYISVAAIGCVGLAAVLVAERLRARRRNRDRVLSDRYLHILMLALASGDAALLHFPLLGRSGARGLLTDVLSELCRVTYGLDPELLRQIVVREHLDERLLRQIRRRRGYRRAAALAQLALLPLDAADAVRVARYCGDRNRYARFYALLVQLTADPSTALRRLSDFGGALSDGEVSEVMAVLRRGMLPIACEPLLESPNRNLRRIGLAIVRQFGVEEAERILLDMVAGEEQPELGCEALYTLCSLRRPVVRQEVLLRLSLMDLNTRKAMMRHMAAEGYSSETLERLFGDCERSYCESLVCSYKRSLA